LVSGKPDKPTVEGNQNLLVQAIVHLLQDSIEAINRRRKKTPNIIPRVEIRMQILDQGPVIELIDNGLSSKTFEWQSDLRPGQNLSTQTAIPGLSRTLAFQIIQQHGGTLEFLENADIRPDDSVSRRAKISFVRPVF
jgi:nitrogen-specific signal transduction histidine kinase